MDITFLIRIISVWKFFWGIWQVFCTTKKNFRTLRQLKKKVMGKNIVFKIFYFLKFTRFFPTKMDITFSFRKILVWNFFWSIWQVFCTTKKNFRTLRQLKKKVMGKNSVFKIFYFLKFAHFFPTKMDITFLYR